MSKRYQPENLESCLTGARSWVRVSWTQSLVTITTCILHFYSRIATSSRLSHTFKGNSELSWESTGELRTDEVERQGKDADSAGRNSCQGPPAGMHGCGTVPCSWEADLWSLYSRSDVRDSESHCLALVVHPSLEFGEGKERFPLSFMKWEWRTDPQKKSGTITGNKMHEPSLGPWGDVSRAHVNMWRDFSERTLLPQNSWTSEWEWIGKCFINGKAP